jgi:hypothetical protein
MEMAETEVFPPVVASAEVESAEFEPEPARQTLLSRR